MIADTGLVVRETVQHAAGLAVRSAVTGHDDTAKFEPKALQTFDAIFDLDQPLGSDPMRLAVRIVWHALQGDQLADRVEIEPELASVGDEGQAGKFRVSIAALAAGRPARIGKQAALLVEADRRHLHTGMT